LILRAALDNSIGAAFASANGSSPCENEKKR
jgi:hypothetical protein